MVRALFRNTLNSVMRNFRLIAFFSVPFLIAFLIPMLSPMPSFVAIGGTFLRFSSIPTDTSTADAIIISVFFLASLFLMCFAVVNINVVVKSERTITNIRREVIDGIGKYTTKLLLIYLTAQLACLAADLLFYEYNMHRTLGTLFSTIVYAALIFVPPALVIDDLRPFRAIEMSVKMLIKKFPLFLLWVLIGIILLTLLDLILMLIKPFFFYTQLLLLVINSLFIVPFLVVLLAHIYMGKYTIVGE
ncbi:MAG: hypothetical protein QXP42_01995 [Candidatus Micrarchaeia archaeon]